jgi:hypothetical protein
MNILTEEDRKAIIQFLAENATDSILVCAAQDTKAERENTRNMFQGVSRYLGLNKTKVQPVVNAGTISVVDENQQEQPPPGEACSKIGSKTKDMLLARCKKPTAPEDIGRMYYPHLKLLWERKLLLWDGTHYTASGNS